MTLGIGDSFGKAWDRLVGASRTRSAASSRRTGPAWVARLRVGHEMGRPGNRHDDRAHDAPDPSLVRNAEEATVWPSDSPRNRF